MKKIIICIFIIAVIFEKADAQLREGMSLHNTCVTAGLVCSVSVVREEFTDNKTCQNELQPQYFKFNEYTDSGVITIQTYGHTGTYTLYGPLSSSGLFACEQISLGQVNEVTGTLNGLLNIEHGSGYYYLRIDLTNCTIIGDGDNSYGVLFSVASGQRSCQDIPVDCKDCLGSFAPGPGKYIVSAWVKGEYENRNTGYQNPGLAVSFSGAPDSLYFTPSGSVIDDWQRIDGVVTIPDSATSIRIGLYCQSGSCSFDDIRFVPVDGSMVSYVYDPVTLKMVAQLDERNYATLYEYDEEGKLIRVKKETEKGIMTIQENRDNIHK